MIDQTVQLPREPHPRWIAHMYSATSGEDHLGLASVSSDQILPMLSPTINVLTIHPRYHSFYAFLLDEFWRRELPRSPRAWIQFFRPRDFIYSIAMHLCDRGEHDLTRGVTGSLKTRPIAAHQPATFDTSTYYIKEPLGGYGLYYGVCSPASASSTPAGRDCPTQSTCPPKTVRSSLPLSGTKFKNGVLPARLRPRRNRRAD